MYHTAAARGSLLHFITTGYWRRVRERPALLLVAAALLLMPAFLAGYWAWRDPGPASGLVPASYQSVTEPRTPGQDLGVSVDEQAALATKIFTNNIQVTFLAFGGGLLLGIGTVYLLLSNGIQLGAVAGLAIGAGNGRPFFELVTAHGVLELSCIIVSAAAGLRMAMAIIDPGHRPRGMALREEARAAVEIVLGTACWLVVAGLFEGFFTPAGTGTAHGPRRRLRPGRVVLGPGALARQAGTCRRRAKLCSNSRAGSQVTSEKSDAASEASSPERRHAGGPCAAPPGQRTGAGSAT